MDGGRDADRLPSSLKSVELIRSTPEGKPARSPDRAGVVAARPAQEPAPIFSAAALTFSTTASGISM